MNTVYTMSFTIKALVLGYFLCTGLQSNSQITVKGPNCVIPGIEYQYVLENLKKDEKLQVCVSDGVIAGTTKECTSGTLTHVRITWKGTTKKTAITIVSPSGKASYNITFTTPLNGGSIISSSKKQEVENKIKPVDIQCSNPSGGGCNPSYQLQWQKSTDKIKWDNIPNETKTYLKFSETLSQTTFFRRRVFDASSGTEAYSNDAAVFVKPDMKKSN